MKEIWASYGSIIKLVAGILGALLVGYLLYRAFLWAKNHFANLNDPSQNLGIDSAQLSHSEAQFGLFADQLEAAMSGTGTDEEAIYEVYAAMKNANDLKQLVKVFGVREYGFPAKNYNLPQWLTAELNADELEPIRTIYSLYGLTF